MPGPATREGGAGLPAVGWRNVADLTPSPLSEVLGFAYLGLWQTFQGGCADGDEVADTPAQISPPQFKCSPVDSCPDQPGLDDVHNFMSYAPRESCWEHFTPLQMERMWMLTELFRPALGK